MMSSSYVTLVSNSIKTSQELNERWPDGQKCHVKEYFQQRLYFVETSASGVQHTGCIWLSEALCAAHSPASLAAAVHSSLIAVDELCWKTRR